MVLGGEHPLTLCRGEFLQLFGNKGREIVLVVCPGHRSEHTADKVADLRRGRQAKIWRQSKRADPRQTRASSAGRVDLTQLLLEFLFRPKARTSLSTVVNLLSFLPLDSGDGARVIYHGQDQSQGQFC